ncbi:unnamed protein product [Calypogeia fissa]
MATPKSQQKKQVRSSSAFLDTQVNRKPTDAAADIEGAQDGELLYLCHRPVEAVSCKSEVFERTLRPIFKL